MVTCFNQFDHDFHLARKTPNVDSGVVVELRWCKFNEGSWSGKLHGWWVNVFEHSGSFGNGLGVLPV